jgi:hypothetical protein
MGEVPATTPPGAAAPLAAPPRRNKRAGASGHDCVVPLRKNEPRVSQPRRHNGGKEVNDEKKRSSRTRTPTQREVLRDVMLAAAKYGAWMTLWELSKLTGYGEASISAQLRHLRRARYGGFLLQKRTRSGEVVRHAEHFIVWEYRLSRKVEQTTAQGRRSVVSCSRRTQGFAR